MAYAKIHIENLGPIREGTFELRPLTIFIGPNNSGKTYAATAAYAMVNALRFDPHVRSQALAGQRFRLQGGPYVTVKKNAIDRRRRLPSEIESQVRAQLQAIRSQVIEDLSTGFLDAFGTENLASLRPRGVGDLSVSLIDAATNSTAFRVGADQIRTTADSAIEVDDSSRISYDFADPDDGTRLHDGLWADVIAKHLWSDDLDRLGLPNGEALYLPAGRLGIIQSWPVLASSAINSLRQRASRSRLDQLPLQGILADYLERLFQLATRDRGRPAYPEHFRPAGDLLDADVLHGEIVREFSSLGMMRLIYRTEELDIALDRASSMVADLAPLAIAMKDQLAIGDVLVLDEPESHLHPESERDVAKVVLRLANAGVHVLLPTHSSTIVHQINNIVRSGLLTVQERSLLGFTDDDLLAPSQIGLYRFHESDHGTIIREVPYNLEFGYSEEEFYDVAEAISDESYLIESRLPVAAG